jgi:hypothetical protein
MKRFAVTVLIASLSACAPQADDLAVAQQVAHRAFEYVAGQDAAAPADRALRAQLDELRDAIGSGDAQLMPAERGEILGRAIVVP